MEKERFTWIVKCLDFDSLTDWETTFLDSCEKRMKSIGDLTPKQEDILENIFKEKG